MCASVVLSSGCVVLICKAACLLVAQNLKPHMCKQTSCDTVYEQKETEWPVKQFKFL